MRSAALLAVGLLTSLPSCAPRQGGAAASPKVSSPPSPANGDGGAAPVPKHPSEAPRPADAEVAAIDPLEVLWGHRLDFAGQGEPLVTIGLMEGQREIAFRTRGKTRISLRGGGTVEVPAGARVTVRARSTAPAAITYQPLLAEAPLPSRDRLIPVRLAFEEKGVLVLSRVVGGVYGIGGRVVDNRRELLLAATSDGSEEAARDALAVLRDRLGLRPVIHPEVVARPRGVLELRSDGGTSLGEADSVLFADAAGDAGFVVEGVEHQKGPASRGREDRGYRGRLYVTLDARGALAVVHGVSLEELLRGLVPSEMPASVHAEALRAQAVTARSNVLAQVGTRHLTDPFMLCAEVHCQAYRGEGARTSRTDEAVDATRGEALFGLADGTLVDAVYSAMCGGHGEDNDQVWDHAPSASLRGKPDLPEGQAGRWAGGLADEARLRAFLSAAPEAYCKRPSGARKDRYRWERRFGAAELDAALATLGVGKVRSITVRARGTSGRARLLEVDGESGRAEVSGELNIRRLLGNLPSAMFVVDRDGSGTLLRGGGWGHGAGMCQWGAVGRAESGQDFREILRAYYSGAEVSKVY